MSTPGRAARNARIIRANASPRASDSVALWIFIAHGSKSITKIRGGAATARFAKIRIVRPACLGVAGFIGMPKGFTFIERPDSWPPTFDTPLKAGTRPR